jgi:hypothetical protein
MTHPLAHRQPTGQLVPQGRSATYIETALEQLGNVSMQQDDPDAQWQQQEWYWQQPHSMPPYWPPFPPCQA